MYEKRLFIIRNLFLKFPKRGRRAGMATIASTPYGVVPIEKWLELLAHMPPMPARYRFRFS